MRRRGNKPVGIAAKIIFLLIVVMVGVVIWSGVRGLQKEPNGPPRGSQSLPAQSSTGDRSIGHAKSTAHALTGPRLVRQPVQVTAISI